MTPEVDYRTPAKVVESETLKPRTWWRRLGYSWQLKDPGSGIALAAAFTASFVVLDLDYLKSWMVGLACSGFHVKPKWDK